MEKEIVIINKIFAEGRIKVYAPFMLDYALVDGESGESMALYLEVRKHVRREYYYAASETRTESQLVQPHGRLARFMLSHEQYALLWVSKLIDNVNAQQKCAVIKLDGKPAFKQIDPNEPDVFFDRELK